MPERSSAVMVLAKSGVGRIVGDRGDLGGVIGEGLLEGGQEMLRRDLGEWRRLERRLPRLQQRVYRAPGEVTDVSKVSDMTIPVFVPNMNGATYITRLGFFGPFALDSGGLFREIAPPNRIQNP